MGIADWNQIQAWRQIHQGHNVTRAEQSLGVDFGPHTRRSRRMLIILLCHDCKVQIVIDEADYGHRPSRRGERGDFIGLHQSDAWQVHPGC